MGKYSVLICADNVAVHSSLTSYLLAEGIDVVSAYDEESALNELCLHSIDVMILDITLPGTNSLEVCRKVRTISDVYTIMISDKNGEMDRIIGLEVGADDYVAKPVSRREIVIRVRKALKRMYPVRIAKKLTLAELTVLPDSYEVFVSNRKVDLTSKEFDVLAFMVSNAGKALRREHILNAVWGYDYCGDFRAVDAVIKRLRQKLTRNNVHYFIRSIYGVGYKIEEVP